MTEQGYPVVNIFCFLMGVSGTTEMEAILLASHLCRLACRLLRMNHSAYLTSQIICTQYLYRHRPFLPKSTLSDPENRVGALLDTVLACVLLASKSHECIRRVRDVVNVGHMLLFHARHRQDSQSQEYYKEMPYVCDAYYVWRDRITKAEIRILRALSFEVQPVVLPTSLLGSYLKALDLHECQSIAQTSMNYVNDAAGGWVYANYSLPSIICASMQLAVENSSSPNIVLPNQWYQVFDVDDIKSVMTDILSVYSIKLDWTLPLTEEETRVFVTALLAETPESLTTTTTTNTCHSPKRSRWEQQQQ